MTDFADTLCSLDVDGLRPVFEPDAGATLDADRAIWTRQKHEAEDRRHAQNARQLITRLPAPGESCHYLWSGTFRHATVVPVILDLAESPCRELSISTLGYDRRCCDLLLGELDAGRIQHLDMVSCVYARAHRPELDKWFTGELASRGFRHAAAKMHAKVLSFEFTDGRAVVVESSSNLRSCAMLELSTISADPTLADFHRQWIQGILDKELSR